MIAIALEKPGQFIAVDGPPLVPAPGDALVRVHRIGICGTDLHAFAGRQPFFSYPRISRRTSSVSRSSTRAAIQTGSRPAIAARSSPISIVGAVTHAGRAGPTAAPSSSASEYTSMAACARRSSSLHGSSTSRARSPTISSPSSRRWRSVPTPSIARPSGRMILSWSSAPDPSAWRQPICPGAGCHVRGDGRTKIAARFLSGASSTLHTRWRPAPIRSKSFAASAAVSCRRS